MQRTKLFLGTIVMVLILFVLTASSFKPEHSKAIISNSNPVKTLAEKREIKLYTIRQQALKSALTTYFDQAIKSGDIVGAGVSIVSGDSVILSNGFGKRSVKGIENVDGETLFRLGSISKGFTGVLAANLESEGKIHWNYQNAMFSLSQEIMLKATGKDIQTLLADKFFKPLNMQSVSMDHQTLINSNNVALPHTKSKGHWRALSLTDKYYNAIAAGGINASSLDMAKWMRFLLGHNPEVMAKDAVEQVFKPYIALNGHSKYYQRWPGHLTSAYGFGWRIHTLKENEKSAEETIWHHGGSVNNYRNEIALFPDSDLGICVLLNGNSKLARTVIPDIHAIVKSIYEQDISTPGSL